MVVCTRFVTVLVEEHAFGDIGIVEFPTPKREETLSELKYHTSGASRLGLFAQKQLLLYPCVVVPSASGLSLEIFERIVS